MKDQIQNLGNEFYIETDLNLAKKQQALNKQIKTYIHNIINNVDPGISQQTYSEKKASGQKVMSDIKTSMGTDKAENCGKSIKELINNPSLIDLDQKKPDQNEPSATNLDKPTIFLNRGVTLKMVKKVDDLQAVSDRMINKCVGSNQYGIKHPRYVNDSDNNVARYEKFLNDLTISQKTKIKLGKLRIEKMNKLKNEFSSWFDNRFEKNVSLDEVRAAFEVKLKMSQNYQEMSNRTGNKQTDFNKELYKEYRNFLVREKLLKDTPGRVNNFGTRESTARDDSEFLVNDFIKELNYSCNESAENEFQQKFLNTETDYQEEDYQEDRDSKRLSLVENYCNGN